MPSAIPYIRFSSDRQKEGSSVDRQEGMIADWLKRHPDYTVSNLKYADLAKSGYHGDHIKEAGGFGKLLKAVADGFVRDGDVVLVEAIDRTGRLPSMEMLSKVITPILTAGVSIITLDDNTTYTKESVNTAQLFLLVAKIQAAHDYSKALSRRVKGSYKKRRALAKESGLAPKRITPVWLNPDGTLRDEVVPWIKTAFELYVSGVGKYTIAHRMRASGVERLSKTSGPTVEGWLRNKATIGYWSTLERTEHHEELLIYPPIIEPALFYKAQIHGDKVKTVRPEKTASHFLVGLVKCAECGKNYIIQNKDRKPHSLRCITRQNKKDCGNTRTIPKPVMDEVYRRTCQRAALEAVKGLSNSVNEQEIAVKEGELREAAKRSDSLMQLVESVGFSQTLSDRFKAVQVQIEGLQADLVLLKRTEYQPTFAEQGIVWKLEKDDEQRLAALLRGVGYQLIVDVTGKISCSHSPIVSLYKGVDRKTGMYQATINGKLCNIERTAEEHYAQVSLEASLDNDDMVGDTSWSEEDYDNLRLQYE